MKNFLRFIGILVAALLCASAADAKIEHLLPKPRQITVGSGSFALSQAVQVVYSDASLTCSALTRFFETSGAGVTTSASAPVVTVTKVASIDGAEDYTLAGYDNEAYQLEVTPSAINIRAITKTGVIRAAQTLTQLAEGYQGTPELEACNITDWPAFKLRGYMHDVGRSFITVDELKKEIDLLSRFKVNTFHWHLTDNQGFRFESKLYPALNSSSSMTRFPGKYYTQAQCTEIEAYAKERGVIVIPEIDMPGHSTAFTTAMGHTMISTTGQAELVNIIGELAATFPEAPYLHLGFDESSTTSAFTTAMVNAVKNNGKKAACWDPYGSGSIPTASMGVELLSGWSSRAADVAGVPFIDSRYNYTNHFDLFADVVAIYKSTIDRVEKGNANVAGTVSAYWNDRKTPTQEDIIAQNNFYANVLASAERAWIGGGEAYIEQGGTILPSSGKEFREFEDWENRFLFHKANSLSEEPIPYVKQTNIHWKITDPFPNDGDKTATFPPEALGPQDSYTYNNTTYNVGSATGGSIYLRHVWGTIVPSYYADPQTNQTAYAWTYVYSPVEQDAGALIEFQNYSRSEKDLAPANGTWDYKGSRIWLNDEEILPPTWDNAGKTITLENDLLNENAAARPPMPIHLKEGWNKVFMKLPYIAISSSTVRLNKWMFTFAITDTQGKNALDGLIYSPARSLDEGADAIRSLINEIRTFTGSVCRDEVGYYPISATDDIEALIQAIEVTLDEEGVSQEERADQLAALSDAFDEFKSNYTSGGITQPLASTEGDEHWYKMYTPDRGPRYASNSTSQTSSSYYLWGNNNPDENSYWKFVDRGDGTFDIVNFASGLYVTTSVISTTTPVFGMTETRPSEGWSILPSSTLGQVILVCGEHQWNMTNGATSVSYAGGTRTIPSYGIIDWGSGTNTTDAGCRFKIEETSIPISRADKLTALPTVSGWYQVSNTAGVLFAQNTTETTSGGYSYPLMRSSATVGANDASSYIYIDADGYKFQSANGHYLDKAAATLTPTAMSGFAYTAGSGAFDSTINILPTTGDVYNKQSGEALAIGANSYGYQWRSNGTTPSLTLTAGATEAAAENNMQPMSAGLYLFSGKNSATKTYTLAVPEGFKITGYQLKFKNVNSSTYTQITVTPSAGGSAVTSARSNNTTTYTVTTSGLSGTTASFTLKNGRSTSTINNNMIVATSFNVYIERTTAVEPSFQIPWTTNGSTIVNASENTEWNLYPLRNIDANYDIYSVNIVNAPDGSAAIADKAKATYGGVASGLSSVYDKGYFFVAKDQVVRASEITGTDYENYNSDATVDTANKTITLTYSYYAPPADDDAVNVTLWASPTTPKNDGTAPSYRIPAIVRTGEGSLLAVGDHRFNLDDVGGTNGSTISKIELVYRHSSDEGKTWTASKVLSTNSSSTSAWNYATGDAAVVADRESGNVLVYCASGSVGMGASTAANPIKVGCFRSTDNGHTWDSGTNVTNDIYGLYGGKATAIFITSGSFLQSRYTKVGDYYRLYAAYPIRTSDQGNGTGVMYSDDFGQTWNLLGGTTLPTGSVYEEGRVEEMPDGSIVLSVRDDNGRTANSNAETLTRGHKNFNIYTFTDTPSGAGYWSMAVSGITGMNNATNNRLLLVPAVRQSDNKQVYVALIAMPTHTVGTQDATNNYGRKNMAFFFKEVQDANDYVNAEALANGWSKGIQVSNNFSAYSDLILLNNNYIGLLYEGNGKHGTGLNGNAQTECYDLIFSSFSLEKITKGKYLLDATFTDRTGYLDSGLEVRVGAKVGKAVGMIGDRYDYMDEKTQSGAEEILSDYRNGLLKQNKIIEDRPYIIRSTQGATMLGTDRTNLVPVAGTDATISEVFTFKRVGTGQWNLYSPNNEVWAESAPASGSIAVAETTSQAETFVVQPGKDGWSAIISQNPASTASSAISCADADVISADRYNKANNPASFWYIEPLEEWPVTLNKASNDATEAYSTLYLPFSTSLPEGVQAYTISDLGDGMAEAVEIGNIPALTPVILKRGGDGGNVTLAVPATQHGSIGVTNKLLGTLRDKVVEDRDKTYVLSAKDGHVGFYHLKSSVNTLKGNRAYLYQTSSSAPSFILNFGGATSVELVRQNDEGGKWYDLSGRRVAAPKNAGVYIKNGKKVFVK